MTTIREVFVREVLDLRGNPTSEVEVEVEEGIIGRAAVPSGTSSDEHEAYELPNCDINRLQGKGVTQRVNNVNNKTGPELEGQGTLFQADLDRLMIETDGGENKSKLGTNATLRVSMSITHAAAESVVLPLWRYLGGVQGPVREENKHDFKIKREKKEKAGKGCRPHRLWNPKTDAFLSANR